MGTASALAADGPHYEWGFDAPPALGEAQERILAEIIASRRSAAPGLRYAVIPLDEVRELTIASTLAVVTRRSQDFLARASREWTRRSGRPEALTVALESLVEELGVANASELAAEAAALLTADPEALLMGALRLDRRLERQVRAAAGAKAFIAELEAQLKVLVGAYPPSALEDIDIRSAQSLARDYFIRAQMPIVVKRARAVRWFTRQPLEDLIQSGNEGLIRAVDKFDPAFGVPFGAYGYGWIKSAISRAEASGRLVRLPTWLGESRSAVRKAVARSEADGARVDLEAVGAEVDLDTRYVQAIISHEEPVMSLDNEGDAIVEKLPDLGPTAEDVLAQRETREAVQQAVSTSGPREREILRSFYGIGRRALPITAIARRLGLTTQRTYQLRNAELRRLRRPAVAKLLVAHI